jgi:hypothetical protein
MNINQYWREHRYVDLWSINHILSGVVLGALLWPLGVSFGVSLIIAVVLFVGWEVVEILIGIKEHMPNMVMDVVCDLAGFFVTGYWYFVLGRPFSPVTIGIWIAVFIAFNIWGFIAYEERKIDDTFGRQ